MRPRNRLQNESVHLAYRRLSRLLSLAGLSLLAIVLLRSQARRDAEQEQEAAAPEFIQTALAPSPFSELGTGVFIAEGPPPAEDPAAAAEPAEAAAPDDDRPKVNRELMERVLDKTSAIPNLAYYHLVNLAVDAPLEVLRKHSHAEAEVGYAHLRTDPGKYRGELIYLSGNLRGLSRFDATANEKLNPHGLKSLYQGDLFTHAAHPNPYILIMHEVPEGLPLGMDLSEQVTFVGFFLKQWRYKTAAGVDRAAPLLIGRMVKWTPSSVPVERNSREKMILTGIVLALVTAVTVVVWLVRRAILVRRRRLGLDPADVADPSVVKADLAQLERDETPDETADETSAANAAEGDTEYRGTGY